MVVLTEQKRNILQDTFFTECPDTSSTKFHGYSFSIHNKGLFLKIWFPNFFGMAHRKADIIAKLLAFTG